MLAQSVTLPVCLHEVRCLPVFFFNSKPPQKTKTLVYTLNKMRRYTGLYYRFFACSLHAAIYPRLHLQSLPPSYERRRSNARPRIKIGKLSPLSRRGKGWGMGLHARSNTTDLLLYSISTPESTEHDRRRSFAYRL